MSRPRKNGLDYFPHDTDASSDEKIELLRAEFGNDGYAFYFIALERIYRNGTGRLCLSSFSERRLFAKRVGVSPAMLERLISLAISVRLFEETVFLSDRCLFSPAIEKRKNFLERDRVRKRNRYNREVVSPGEMGGEMGGGMGVSPGEMGGEVWNPPPERKEKKRKENTNTKDKEQIATSDRSEASNSFSLSLSHSEFKTEDQIQGRGQDSEPAFPEPRIEILPGIWLTPDERERLDAEWEPGQLQVVASALRSWWDKDQSREDSYEGSSLNALVHFRNSLSSKGRKWDPKHRSWVVPPVSSKSSKSKGPPPPPLFKPLAAKPTGDYTPTPADHETMLARGRIWDDAKHDWVKHELPNPPSANEEPPTPKDPEPEDDPDDELPVWYPPVDDDDWKTDDA